MEVDPPPAALAPAEPGSAPAVAPAPVAPRRIGHWQVDKQIGRGSFAVVWRARHAETGQRVAVKEIRLDKLNRKLRESLSPRSRFCSAAGTGTSSDSTTSSRRRRGSSSSSSTARGDVSEFIKKHGRVREDVARHFMRQMASGLRAMRAQNLIHRDLKPQNLLLTVASPDAELKIADFGFARYMHPARGWRRRCAGLRCTWRPRSWATRNTTPRLTCGRSGRSYTSSWWGGRRSPA